MHKCYYEFNKTDVSMNALCYNFIGDLSDVDCNVDALSKRTSTVCVLHAIVSMCKSSL